MRFRPQFSEVTYSTDYRNMPILADNPPPKRRKVGNEKKIKETKADILIHYMNI